MGISGVSYMRGWAARRAVPGIPAEDEPAGVAAPRHGEGSLLHLQIPLYTRNPGGDGGLNPFVIFNPMPDAVGA